DPIFDGDHVAFLYDDHVVKLSFADQRIDWRVPVGDDVRLRRGAHSDDLLVIGAQTVRRISLDGKILARRDGLGGAVHHMPALVTADAAYLCGGSRAYALDSVSLRLLWKHDEASGYSPCPVAVTSAQ